MKRYRFIPIAIGILFLLLSFTACKDKNKTPDAENDIDAARNFIRAALDGKFDEARTLLLSDSVNINWMDIAERNYMKADAETKYGYRTSSINIHQVQPLNDSNTVVIYSNSFKNDHDTLKVINENGKWLIDLKYLFQHDADTMLVKPLPKDSIP